VLTIEPRLTWIWIFSEKIFSMESSDVHVDLFICNVINYNTSIKVITKLPNSEQSYKGKVQTHIKKSKLILKTSANCCTSRTKLYDKRNDFTFPIINSKPFISTIPSAPAYISQLIRYSRDCTQYSSFQDRQGYVGRRLKSLLPNVNGHGSVHVVFCVTL
jgi:hypothetical protein